MFIAGEPILLKSDMTPEEMEENRAELEKRLTDITKKADEYFS